ncbi:MAG: HisA/HisF-related TIM barrel protein [Promethearchaeota archaeon]|jgi:phosphoribosylformimino-5-aminoimidazole carboxamide ribotide isomerase
MREFKVIPVIDILKSEAVHAIRGERKNYKPLASKLFKTSNPLDILKVLASNFKFKDFYIADLDAIINNKPNFHLLKKFLQISDINIMIDPGIVDIDDILLYSKFDISKLIIGLETVKNLEVIREAVNILGKNKLILSIDMYKQKVLSNAKRVEDKNPIKIANIMEEIGVNELILLDLFRVGQKIGGIPQQYLKIQDSFGGNIFVGGGIKDYNDLIKYKKCNFAGVLIATALYDGTINIEKVRNLSLS